MELRPSGSTDAASLEQLRQQHREAELRLRELERHLSLSPDEQLEAARLKKRKLQLKDRMRALGAGF